MTSAMRKAQEKILTTSPNKESLYRTRWLLAHNRLHAIAHETGDLAQSEVIRKEWDGYLSDLRAAEEVAGHQA